MNKDIFGVEKDKYYATADTHIAIDNEVVESAWHAVKSMEVNNLIIENKALKKQIRYLKKQLKYYKGLNELF